MNKSVLQKVRETGRPVVFVNMEEKVVETYLPEGDAKLFDKEFIDRLAGDYVNDDSGETFPHRLFIGGKLWTVEG